MRPALLAVLALAVLAAPGCGPDARLVYAEDTARITAAALVEIETSGGEDAPEPLQLALERTHVRLDEIEISIEQWRDHSGSLAYRTHAPCLRAALIAVRDALLAASMPVPSDLDEADAMLAEVADHTCDP